MPQAKMGGLFFSKILNIFSYYVFFNMKGSILNCICAIFNTIGAMMIELQLFENFQVGMVSQKTLMFLSFRICLVEGIIIIYICTGKLVRLWDHATRQAEIHVSESLSLHEPFIQLESWYTMPMYDDFDILYLQAIFYRVDYVINKMILYICVDMKIFSNEKFHHIQY